MTIEPRAITFNCRDPHKVAVFWAGVLGRHIAATSESGSAAILGAIPLYFRQSGQSDGTVGNNIHLDLSTTDLDADAARLRELGATELSRMEWHSTESITFLDVEGNQFDLTAE
jgi:hypothetical protein